MQYVNFSPGPIRPLSHLFEAGQHFILAYRYIAKHRNELSSLSSNSLVVESRHHHGFSSSAERTIRRSIHRQTDTSANRYCFLGGAGSSAARFSQYSKVVAFTNSSLDSLNKRCTICWCSGDGNGPSFLHSWVAGPSFSTLGVAL